MEGLDRPRLGHRDAAMPLCIADQCFADQERAGETDEERESSGRQCYLLRVVETDYYSWRPPVRVVRCRKRPGA